MRRTLNPQNTLRSGTSGGYGFLRLTSLLLVGVLCIKLTTVEATPSINYSDYCRSVNRELGKCVPLQQCTLFSSWLKQRPVIKNNLRIIVKFTCYFDIVQPKVCCPLREIDENDFGVNQIQDNSGFANNNPSSTPIPSPSPNPKNSNANTKDTLILSRNQIDVKKRPEVRPHSFDPIHFPTEKDPQRETQIRSNKLIRDVSKLRLLPDLENCGNSVQLGRLLGTFGAYSWLALLGYKDQNSPNFEHICSGAIINNRYILTSAQCLSQRLTHVRLGEYNLDTTYDKGSLYLDASKYKDHKIEKVQVHRRFNELSLKDNIALIRVEKEIDFSTTFVKPVCLPLLKEYGISETLIPENEENLDLFKKIKTIVAGWGRIYKNSTGYRILQEAPVQISSRDECDNPTENYGRAGQPLLDPSKQYCIGGNRRQNSCIVDAGGPLLAPFRININAGTPRALPTPKVFQLGIFSSGPTIQQCRNDNSNENHRLVLFRSGSDQLANAIPSPSVFTKVTPYLDWILDSIEP